jgi:TM2 domain-containing membrane protein YozV
MAAEVLCGRCGSVLSGPAARCAACGAAPSVGAPRSAAAGRLRPLPKNPWVAAALSAVVPGLGQVYLGRYARGFGYLVGTLGLEFFGFDLDLTAIGAAVGIPLELGGAGLWLHGIVDAYLGAKRAT